MRQCASCYRQFDDAVSVCPYDGAKLGDPDPHVGRLIDGKYRVTVGLGSGTLARWYRALHVQIGRTVVVKVSERIGSDAAEAERFRREAQVVARLRHPGVVGVYDFGVSDDVGAYLVMEYVDGPSLREELRRGPLPLSRAVAVGVQVCEALDAAHALGLVHCGISPDNIFIERSAKGDVARLADFGLSRLGGVRDSAPVQAAPGTVMGDPPYMAPEQWTDGLLDQRTDVYALGCVLYEALTGRTPFPAPASLAIQLLFSSAAPARPSENAPDVSRELDDVILRAIAKRPDDRFGTARELGDALEVAARTPVARSALAEPALLDKRYRVVRQIGQGGMGVVFEAIDERFGSRVAIKKMLVEGAQLRIAFEREARLLNGLRHPVLPHVTDYFSDGGAQFLVMQYVGGEDLGHMLTRGGVRFAHTEVLGMADQLLDALEYLHSRPQPVIHRDIKPQNLKLTPESEVMLLDFGLAKGHAGHSSHHSGVSVAGFTPAYAPLEQMRGQGTDAASDLYSLGATLYHLLTGVAPPDAGTRAEAALDGRSDPLVPVTNLNHAVAPAVSDVVLRAMAQRRSDRYATASEMRAALRSAHGAAVTESEAPTLLKQTENDVTTPGPTEDASG